MYLQVWARVCGLLYCTLHVKMHGGVRDNQGYLTLYLNSLSLNYSLHILVHNGTNF